MRKDWRPKNPPDQDSSGRPNWPSKLAVQTGRPNLAVQPSNSASLPPSRIIRTQINPKILNSVYEELMQFLAANRGFKLQDIIERGIELALAEIASARGRPIAGRLDGQSLDGWTANRSDQIDPIDRFDPDDTPDGIDPKKFVDHSSGNQLIPGRLDGQRESLEKWIAVLHSLRERISQSDFQKWFGSIEFEGFDHSRQVIVLRAPNQVVKDTIVTNLGRVLAESLNANRLAGYAVAWNIGATSGTLPREYCEREPQRKLTAGDSKDELLNYYSVVMERPITQFDRDEFDKISDCTPDAVRTGILQSRLKSRDPVQHFKYCLPAIRQIQKSGLAMVLLPKYVDEFARQPLLPELGAEVSNLKRKDR